MFATLLGGLPRPPLDAAATPEAILDACLELQLANGIEPLTDAGWGLAPEDVSGSWRATAARTDALTKAVVTGPFSSGRPPDAVRADLLALADAGCRWIEVHEPEAVSIGEDREARARFADAHRALTADLAPEVHLSLAIVGGNADTAGIDTILAGAYASLAVDLIAGPDNWRLAVRVPGDRGVICGAVSTTTDDVDGLEVLLWAAGYAASSGARGWDRVGLATAGSLVDLPWEVAEAKIRRLGEAARLATASPEVRRAAIDPRAISARSAAGFSGPARPPAKAPRRARRARRRS
jgi:hypothetical protein